MAPQVVAERVVQTFPTQQPDGQEVRSQTHAPPSQCCPAAHTGPPPQLHSPPAQVSARRSQTTQASPLVPQAVREGVAHVLPEQHPVLQLVASQPDVQTPPTQLPVMQGAQALPPLPHADGVVPARHRSPSQQPPQDVLSHTQIPPTQC